MSRRTRLDTDRIQIALDLAKEAHQGQKRWGGEPFIVHPIRVALKAGYMTDYMIGGEPSGVVEALTILGLLHDVVEDSEMCMGHIERSIRPCRLWRSPGFSIMVSSQLHYLTRRKRDSYVDYIERMMQDIPSVCIKLCDLHDNLSDLGDRQQRRDKYELATNMLLNRLLSSGFMDEGSWKIFRQHLSEIRLETFDVEALEEMVFDPVDYLSCL